MTRTRIAVVGAGLIGRAHIQAIQSIDTMTLHALVDPTREPSAWPGGQAPAGLEAWLADLVARPLRTHGTCDGAGNCIVDGRR